MSYIARVNPFTWILCVPFYYVSITIFISWVFTMIELCYIFAIQNFIYRLEERKSKLEITINHKLRSNYRKQLESYSIDGYYHLPSEIISIIMDMSPKIDENWKTFGRYHSIIANIDFKQKMSRYSLFIYPICRLLMYMICFILIMIRYGKWYNSPWVRFVA